MTEPTPPKKQLHEYRREATQEELDQIARYLAEGRTKAYMAREMRQTTDRVCRLIKRVEVIQAAVRLRETEIIPRALTSVEESSTALLEAVIHMSERLQKLERAVASMSMAMAMKKVKAEKTRTQVKTLRKERDELRSLVRKRGLIG